MKQKINVKIELVSRTYKLLFPNRKVVIFLVLRPVAQLEQASEVAAEHDITSFGLPSAQVLKVLINEHIDGPPTHTFIITAAAVSVELPGAKPRCAVALSCKSRLVAFVRNQLSGRVPLAYEAVKHQYVMLLTQKRQSVQRSLKHHFVAMQRMDQGGTVRPAISKVAIVAMHWLDVGGAEKFAVHCCEKLHAAGYEVHVLVAHISKPFYEKQLQNVASIYVIDSIIPPAYRLDFVVKFVEFMGVGLIHNHHNIYVYDSLPIIRDRGFPVRVVDSLHIDERIDGGFPKVSIGYSSYLDAHHLISRRLVEIFKDAGIPENKLCLGYLAGNLAMPNRCNIERSLNERRLKIIFVGRMTWQKRPILFVAALERIRRMLLPLGIELSGEMIGEGKYLEATKTALRHYRLDAHVKLLPADTDVQHQMKSADILLLTSENEGVALVAFEAIRHGCLVISTDVGAQREIIPTVLLTNPEPVKCVRDSVHIVRKIVTSEEFRINAITAQAQKVDVMNTLPKGDAVLHRLYANW